jgi:1,4-dihydroxy-2-naphthoate octaprenyltransferase
MISYYVITGQWDWNVVYRQLLRPGVTGFSSMHTINEMDKSKRIYTLPVILGERWRYTVVGMLVCSTFCNYLTIIQFSVLLIVLTESSLSEVMLISANRSQQKPPDFPDVWPNYFVAAAFIHNRRFGILYLLGLILNAILIVYIL